MNGSQNVCGREDRLRKGQEEHRRPKDDYFSKNWDALCRRRINVGRLADTTSTSTQHQSLFFTQLPLEIRFRIYSLVLPRHRRLWVRPVSEDADGWLEHFPCNKPPTDTTWNPTAGFLCCIAVDNGFFEYVRAAGIQPHPDSLALMQTCQQVYVETCRLWTFCFDELATLRAFARLTPHLPVCHVQVMVYAHHKLYCDDPKGHSTTAGWQRSMNASWERKLWEIDALCRTIPGLRTLLLSVHAIPRFGRLENEDAVMESLGMVTAAPQVRVERLRLRLRGGATMTMPHHAGSV